MDIYFTEKYAQVNALLEGGEAVHLGIECAYGHITHNAIKRETGAMLDGGPYYDLITPYGYGGPLVREYTDIDRLMEVYMSEMEAYCKSEHIVSEFIRFHPLFSNQEPFTDIYDVEHIKETVGTDLLRFEDTFQSEFSSSARKITRRILKDERFECTLARGFDDIAAFMDIYTETMMRNNASGFYYFDREYFQGLADKFGDDLMTITISEGDYPVAMGLYFISGDIVYEHLKGTRDAYLRDSTSYLMKYNMIRWAEENGYSLIHYGGGITNADNDPLLEFKKRFGRNTSFKFHIGRKIWNHAVYDALCRKSGIRETDYFPAYRTPQHTAGSK
ncbi:GNAT family N-acetyltransferase [Salinicoccus roseus]|uniref:GNAT family N-acetyltransferase n=1 Tax=Salinicoccus roseus TaxID=45670 RepID=UPI0023002D92|nr:GNAT family N-acetyltransferase [Salinicoccus roseus]